MDGNADRVVLFEHDHVVAAGGEAGCRHQPCGAGTDDDDVACVRGMAAQNFRPLDSHVPSKVIQKERIINRTLSHSDAFLT